MDILIYLFAAGAGIAALLATIAIWAPRRTPVRVAAVLITALFLPFAYVQAAGLLSKPKPMAFEWFDSNAKVAVVLGASLHEDEAIYLWLVLDDAPEPRYYVLPWERRFAERLQDAMEGAVSRNSNVIIKMPFIKRSLDQLSELNVEITPPPTPPMKPPPFRSTPRVFNPRDGAI